jgi:hypothetical protein
LKGKIRKSLLKYISYLEEDSTELDGVLHLERTCKIIKTVIEIDGSVDEQDELFQRIRKYNEK